MAEKTTAESINRGLIFILVLVLVIGLVAGYIGKELTEPTYDGPPRTLIECLERALSMQDGEFLERDERLSKIANCTVFVKE